MGFCQVHVPPAVRALGLELFDPVGVRAGIAGDGLGFGAADWMALDVGSSFGLMAAAPCTGKAAATKTASVPSRPKAR
jgi:hypothetical protein